MFMQTTDGPTYHYQPVKFPLFYRRHRRYRNKHTVRNVIQRQYRIVKTIYEYEKYLTKKLILSRDYYQTIELLYYYYIVTEIKMT